MQSQVQVQNTAETAIDTKVLRELLSTEIMFIGGGEIAGTAY